MDDPLKLENQVCFALVTAARNVVSLYRPVLEPLGLTHPQYLVMLALWESAPGARPRGAPPRALGPAPRARSAVSPPSSRWSRRRSRRW